MSSYTFEIGPHNTANALKESMDKICKLPPPSKTDVIFLLLREVVVAPPIVKLLIQILNQPPSLAHVAIQERKWGLVGFANCRVPRPRASRFAADYESLASTLARRTMRLGMWGSLEILECVSDAPKLEINELMLNQERLSALDCQRLGDLFQKNVHLTNLIIQGPSTLDEPQIFVECLANAQQLQRLEISENYRHYLHRQGGQALIDIVVRQGGNDMVGRLLQKPQSQLKILHLTRMDLDDHHFKTIVEALPTSQLEELNVAVNYIHCGGIMAFAKQLPKIKCLKHVDLSGNPWELSMPEWVWEKILEGILKNYSIECINTSLGDLMEDGHLVSLYCYMNWAGRRLLATSSSVPLGLWPFILERAGKGNDRMMGLELDLRPYAIYLFLQQSPILSSIHSSLSLKNRPRKKNKIMT